LSPPAATWRPTPPTAHCRALRAQGRPKRPSTIAQERAINPFMRCDNAAVIAQREWKNPF
jgi:hydroxyacylglutathione hydrolase